MRIFLAVAIVILFVRASDASSIYRRAAIEAKGNAATDLVKRAQISQSKQQNQNGRNIANQEELMQGYGAQTDQSQQTNVQGKNLGKQYQSSYGDQQTSQNKQQNQNGRNIGNQNGLMQGYGTQLGQSEQSNYGGDSLANLVQSSYGGYQTLQNKQSNSFGKNVGNLNELMTGYGPQIGQNQQKNVAGDNVSNQVQEQFGGNFPEQGQTFTGYRIPVQQNVNAGDNSQFNTGMQNGYSNSANLAQQRGNGHNGHQGEQSQQSNLGSDNI